MSDRRQNPISDSELNRRWKAVRAGMAERGIDALVMQNNNDWLGGYVKWFTDFPAYNGYPRTVIFHAADAMTVDRRDRERAHAADCFGHRPADHRRLFGRTELTPRRVTQIESGREVGRHHIMTHAYWREGGPEFKNVNIMGVAHGTDKQLVLAHKAAIDEHLKKCGIDVTYTNVFWGGRSEIKP